MPQNASWQRGKDGLTLIEVMASLALLGTLLATLTMAHGRHRKQVRLAERRLSAVAAADTLLTSFDAAWQPPRHGQNGVVPGDPNLTWQIRAVDVPAAWKLGAQVLRLEVWDTQLSPEKPLAFVDTLSTEISPTVDSIEKKSAAEPEPR